jgi:hypothetical protein
MDLNFDNIYSQLLISCLGMAFFMYGKKAQRLVPLMGGIALGIFPYFLTNFWTLWGVTMGVMGALFYLRDQ